MKRSNFLAPHKTESNNIPQDIFKFNIKYFLILSTNNNSHSSTNVDRPKVRSVQPTIVRYVHPIFHKNYLSFKNYYIHIVHNKLNVHHVRPRNLEKFRHKIPPPENSETTLSPPTPTPPQRISQTMKDSLHILTTDILPQFPSNSVVLTQKTP